LLLDRKQLNIFEREAYRRILRPVHDNEKENWRILTNKEMHAMLKKNLHQRLPYFGTLREEGREAGMN
jgi:hypothetical protein